MKYSILKLFTTILAMAILFGCNDDEPEPENEAELDAAITFSPETPEVGDEVTLDASTSTDRTSVGYTVEWSILSKPDNSSATIGDNTAVTTAFTPDLEGDYEIQLEISSADEGVSDTETTSISVLASGYVELSGPIASDRVLENIHEDPGAIDYLVTGNLAVSARLTVDPGVLIHFQEDMMLSIDQGGTLIAEGTETDTIVFTTANAAGNILWKGVFINSATAENILKYAEVSYAGNSEMNFSGEDYPAGVGINSNGTISIEHSFFKNNDGYGVYLDDDGGQLNTFTANSFSDNAGGVGIWASEVDAIDNTSTFSNNAQADVEIFSSTVAEDTEITWSALNGGSSYTISGNINVDGTLTIAPGAKFEMDEDVIVNVNGAFIASGTSEDHIVFTTSDDAYSLLWKGIYVNSSDARNILNYVDLSYAGNSTMNFSGEDFAAGVAADAAGKLSVTNSSFSNNKGYGLYIDDDGGKLETFEANNFVANDQAVGVPADEADAIDGASVFTDNINADVEIFASTYAESNASTWQKLSESASYRVSGNLAVNGDLTIAPGAILTFDQDVMVLVDGSLIAEGTSADRITFTTSNLNGGLYWTGIFIRSATNQNSFDYVDLSYAGNSEMDFAGENFAAGIGVNEGGKVSVTNSDISNNQNYGLYIDDGGGELVNFSGNTFSMNNRAVGVPADEVDAITGNSTFSDNNVAEVEIFGTSLSDTKVVSWNALSGDASYRVTGDLNILGELTVLPGASFEMDEDVQITVDGAFVAEGNDGNMITFTSSNIDGGLLWKGFFFRSADARNAFDYAIISYGGNSPHDFSGENFAANVAINTDAQAEITNSIISNSGDYGIYSKGTTNDFLSATADNTLINNVSGSVLN